LSSLTPGKTAHTEMQTAETLRKIGTQIAQMIADQIASLEGWS
jgi:hypothetical protein